MKYEILFTDRHTEIVDHETMENLVYELESFERTDVSQIHEYDESNPDEVGKTIWTEEEGLFVSYGELDYEDDDEDEEETSMNYKIYSTDLLNRFYLELFSTDFRDYDSPTQNSKTDYLFDYDNFDDWFENVISVFVDDTDCDENELRTDLQNCSQFVEDMKLEYKELLEICSNEDDE